MHFIVPKWAIGKHIMVFAGTEILAVKEVKVSHHKGKHIIQYLPLKIKSGDGRCSGCGSCCESGGIPIKLRKEMRDALENFDSKNLETCPFLDNQGCILRGWIPFSCARSVCTQYEGCTERMEVIE